MLKQMKYELRKTWFSKLVLLVMTAVAEAVFLIGLLRKSDNNMGAGIVMLVLIASFGILYIGIDSLLVLHRDLNTKQGYMLFMTPNSSYKILGAKVLENGISIFLSGAFYIGLAALDIRLVLNLRDGAKNVVQIVQELMQSLQIPVDLSFKAVCIYILSILASWLAAVVIAAFAIIISSALLTGTRWNLLVSFLIFLGLNFLCSRVAGLVPMMQIELYYLVTSLIHLGFALAAYIGACIIMDEKLSL